MERLLIRLIGLEVLEKKAIVKDLYSTFSKKNEIQYL